MQVVDFTGLLQVVNKLQQVCWIHQVAARLQRMAVFDEISGAEKPKLTSAGAQTSYQALLISQLRCKNNKKCVRNNEN